MTFRNEYCLSRCYDPSWTKYEVWGFPHCQRPHVDCKMKNNNYIIVLLLCFTHYKLGILPHCFTHYKLGILPHVHLLYILSLCTCYNISIATSLTRRVLHCMCECMKIGYMYLLYFMHCTCMCYLVVIINKETNNRNSAQFCMWKSQFWQFVNNLIFHFYYVHEIYFCK